MTEQMTTSEVLYGAADEINRRGWTQGPNGWRVKGPVCALGGIGAALDWRAVDGNYCSWEVATKPSAEALAQYLGVRVGHDGDGVYRWNDAPGRTAAEVIEALRAAAVIEEAKENPTAANSPATHADTASEAVTGR